MSSVAVTMTVSVAMLVAVSMPVTIAAGGIINGTSGHEHNIVSSVSGCPIHPHRLYFAHHHVAGRRRGLANVDIDLLSVCRSGA